MLRSLHTVILYGIIPSEIPAAFQGQGRQAKPEMIMNARVEQAMRLPSLKP